jgi:hypothetical protein
MTNFLPAARVRWRRPRPASPGRARLPHANFGFGFSEALAAIPGERASGLSATNIVRLKVAWEADYATPR